MKKTDYNIKQNIKFSFLLMLTLLLSIGTAWAEGSKDLYPNGATGGRAYLRASTTANLSYPFPNLGTHYVYAKAGEQIALASNAQSGSNKRIYLYSPTGADVTPTNFSSGSGNIPNRNAEVAGPILPGQATAGSNRYTPIYYTVPAGGEGIYKVEFRGTSNSTSGDSRLAYASATNWPTGGLSGSATLNNSNYLIAWDISVAKQTGGTWDWQPGRVYTQVLNMDNPSYQSSGGFNVFRANSGFYGKFNVLTRDGYVYNVKNNGNQGISFTFMVNNRGFHAVGDVNTPSYQSIAAPDVAAVTSRYHDPRTADNAAAVTQKIFYNLPDGTMPESATGAVPGNSTWLRVPEKLLDVTDVKITGVEGTPGVVGHKGAYIEFTNESGGDYHITIKPKVGSGNSFPHRLYSGQSNIGLNKIFWDGKDGAGNALPAGGSEVDIEINIRGAEVHFPYVDMELNHNGIVIELLNTDLLSVKSDRVYWNDSAIRTVTTSTYGAMTNPRNASHTAISNGTSSNTNGHIWGTGSNRANGTFGDEQGMDTWTFIEGDKVTIDFDAEVKIADLYTEIAYTINGQSNPSSAKPGDAIVLKVKAGNKGPSDVIADHANGINGALFTFELPAGIDVASVVVSSVCTNGTAAEAVELAFDEATRMYRSELSLSDGCYIEYTFTGTLNGVNGAMVPEATIMRPADVTDPDATNPDELAPTNPHYECYNNDDSLPGSSGSIGCNNITEVSFLVLDDCIDEVLYYEDFDRGYWEINDGRTDWFNRSSISILNGAIQTDVSGNILRNGPEGGATPVYLFAPGQNDTRYTLANGSPHSTTVSVARIKNGYYAVLPPGYVQMGIPTTDSWSTGLWDPNAPTNDPTLPNSNYDWTPAWDKVNTIRDISGAVNGAAFLVRGNNASNNSVKPFYEFDLNTTIEKDKVYSLNLYSYVTYHDKDYMLMDVIDNVTGHIYATVPLKYPGPGLPPGASPEGFSLGWVPLQASFSFSEGDCAILAGNLDIKIAIRGSHDPLLDVGKGFGHTLIDNIMFTSEKVGQGCATNVAGITCADDCYRDINGEGFEWRHEEGALTNGTVLTQTFNQPGSDGGFVLDIYKLDNSFNMNINGVDLFDEEIEFQSGNPGNSGGITLVQNIRFKSDGAKWTANQTPGGIWTINAGETIDLTDRQNNPTPVVRVIIDRWGNAKMYAKRSTAAPLEELELFDKVNPTTVKYLSQVLWNEDAANTILVNQLVVGTTAMSGFGYGQEYKDCETCELDKEGVFVDGNNNGFSEVGEQIKYTFDVRNLGDMEIHDIEITDPLLGTNIKVIQDSNGDWITNRADVTFTGDNTNFGVLDRNETWTFTVNYTVTNTDIFTNKGVYNRATVTGTGRVFNSDNERNVEVESKDPTPYDDTWEGWDPDRPYHTFVPLKGGGLLITNPMIYQRTK